MALVVLLDVEGAFDNNYYDSICSALTGHGVDHTILRWIRANLEGRLANAAAGGVSRNIAVSKGFLRWVFITTLMVPCRE
jgi:hypothetical protein